MSVLGPVDASGDQVRLTLHSRGMRVTPTRVAVLAALTDDSADVHHTAPELYQNLTAAGVEIDLVTVYRAGADEGRPDLPTGHRRPGRNVLPDEHPASPRDLRRLQRGHADRRTPTATRADARQGCQPSGAQRPWWPHAARPLRTVRTRGAPHDMG